MKRTGFKNRGTGLKSSSSMKRKPMKCKPVKRKKENSNPAYMERVAQLGCIICERLGYGWIAAEVHHKRTGAGAGLRAKDTDTCPLCPTHHRGEYGIHHLGRKVFEKLFDVTEIDLIVLTQQRLGYSEAINE